MQTEKMMQQRDLELKREALQNEKEERQAAVFRSKMNLKSRAKQIHDQVFTTHQVIKQKKLKLDTLDIQMKKNIAQGIRKMGQENKDLKIQIDRYR